MAIETREGLRDLRQAQLETNQANQAKYLTSLDVVFNDADVKGHYDIRTVKDSSEKAHYQYIN